MSAVFDLNYEKLASDPRFAAIARELGAQSRIESQASFNRYCQEACRLWNKHFDNGVGRSSTLFSALLDRVDEGKEEVIKPVFYSLEDHKKHGSFIDAGLRAVGGVRVGNVVQLLLSDGDLLLIAGLRTGWMCGVHYSEPCFSESSPPKDTDTCRSPTV